MTDPLHSAAVTRSEEELVVETVWRPAERVRLIRRVVEEEVMVPVTVRREELHIEREPMSPFDDPGRDAGTALGGPPGDDEFVVVLREERPVVGVEVVPREIVRVRRERVDAGEERFADTVRREVVEVDEPDAPGPDRA